MMPIKVCLFASPFRYEGRSPWLQATRIPSRGGSNHREVDYINKCALPKGARRLLEIELIARELPGWVQAGIQTPRVTDLLRLPPWHLRSSYLWPPGMK